jgi:hypothetical protein
MSSATFPPRLPHAHDHNNSTTRAARAVLIDWGLAGSIGDEMYKLVDDGIFLPRGMAYATNAHTISSAMMYEVCAHLGRSRDSHSAAAAAPLGLQSAKTAGVSSKKSNMQDSTWLILCHEKHWRVATPIIVGNNFILMHLFTIRLTTSIHHRP